MKRTRLIMMSIAAAALIVACSNMIISSRTSLVTITIGSDKVASIDIQRATLLAKVKNFILENIQVPAAAALVPQNVVRVSVDITASDMETITQTVDVAGQSSVSIAIEVPNGLNREFVITGLDIAGARTYWGGASADLDGSPMTLSVQMTNLGAVTNILYVSVSGNDSTGDGTQQNSFRTITWALFISALSKENAAIIVGPGTYDTKNGEGFPLQLNTGTALVCRGANHTTVINSGALTAIYGNIGAIIDGCQIVPSTGGIAVDDSAGGATPAAITINNCLITAGGVDLGTIYLTADSMVTNSTITRANKAGIEVISGNPKIENNVITGNTIGINVLGGNPVINNNSIYCNTAADLVVSVPTSTINATANSWDHDSNTDPTGPTVGGVAGCPAGTDICGGTVTYIPFNPAVPGGCLL